MPLPLLAISFTDDSYAPVNAVKHLLDKCSHADITHLHMDPHDLNTDVLSHFKWTTKGELIAPLLDQWLQKYS